MLSILIVSDVMNNIVSDMMFRCCPINQRSHERSNVKLMRRCRLISFQDELFSSHEHQCIRALGLPLQAIFVWRKTWGTFEYSDINMILNAMKLCQVKCWCAVFNPRAQYVIMYRTYIKTRCSTFSRWPPANPSSGDVRWHLQTKTERLLVVVVVVVSQGAG